MKRIMIICSVAIAMIAQDSFAGDYLRRETAYNEVKEKCNGDKNCILNAKDVKADDKDELRDEIERKCPTGGDKCRREVIKNHNQEFRETHPQLTK